MVDTNFKIDFRKLNKDFLAEARDRILYQFKNSPVLDQILQVISIMNQNLYDEFVNMLKQRSVADATGVNLDIIGDIVGQPRGLTSASIKIWFTPDSEIAKFDNSLIWVKNAAESGNEKMTDEDYRKIIVSKIIKNHQQLCSIPELKRYAQLLTGYEISFRKTGVFKIALVVPKDMPASFLYLLMSKKSDKKIDNYYVLPIPAGVELDEHIYYI